MTVRFETGKMNTIFIISALCLRMASAAVRLTMPVVLIDNENTLHGVLSFPNNPFHKMDTTSFSEIIRSATYRSERIIIFVEDQFSIEDITTKDKLGTSYHHLHQGILDSKVKFIPNVYEPYKTIKQMFPPLDTNVFYVSDDKTKFDSNFKYYYVYFQDNYANETRVERLRRHDKIMRTVFFTVRQLSPGPVVAFYTGKANPVSTEGSPSTAEEMPEPVEPESSSVMIVTDAALFWLSGVYSTAPPASYGGARRSMQSAPALTEQSSSARRMSTRMLYSDFELEFGFSYRPDGWLLDAVSLLEGGEVVGRSTMGVGAPWDWSYYCGEPICIFNTRDKSAVIIEKYQLEPLRKDYEAQSSPVFRDGDGTSNEEKTTDDKTEDGKTKDDKTEDGKTKDDKTGDGKTKDDKTEDGKTKDDKTEDGKTKDDKSNGGNSVEKSDDEKSKTSFTQTLNCGPYFSSAILACLMVSAFLLCILFYGITMLMNCHTNSTFDDVNQKPLVIMSQM